MSIDPPIRIVIADDQTLVRAGLRAILQRGDDLEVVAEAGDGVGAITQGGLHHPDVILMDIRMPGTDGITATAAISADAELAHIRVIMLTTYDTDENILDAIEAGAAGFLLKDTEPERLRESVRTVAQGDALLSPSVTTRVLAHLVENRRHPRAEATGDLDRLTDRERDVLREVGRGRSNEEISAALFISPATARTYVSRLLAKLDARDRANLVIIAYETGLR